MSFQRAILLLSLMAVFLVILTSGESMAAGLGPGDTTPNPGGVERVEFPPVQVRAAAVVFRPTGIAAISAQSAYLRLGGRHRSVPLAGIRAALGQGDTVRIALPSRLLAVSDPLGRNRREASYTRSATRVRLGIVYRATPAATGALPATEPPAGDPGTGNERSVRTETPTGTELPPVEPPPMEPPSAVGQPLPIEQSPTYFVSPVGSDSNPGTKAQPFRSLGKAYKAAVPGETVEVEAGNYPAQQTIAYDPSKAGATEPVTFIAKGHAHFEAAEPTSSYSTNVGGSHITFQGDFEFDFVSLREDVHGMTDVTFRETWLHHLSEAGNLNGFYLYDNRMGPNNLWPSTGSVQTSNTGPDDILNFGVGSTCAPQACFESSAKNVNVVGNTFNGAYNSWAGSHSDCIQYTVGQSGYIADNTFQNCQNETLILQESIGRLANITIENNYLGLPIEATDPYAVHLSPCSNCTLRFNSVPPSGSLLYVSASALGVTSAQGERIYGNIAGRYDGGQCATSKAYGWTWDYNLFIGAGGVCGTHAATTSDQLYMAAGSMDLDIPAGSPAVDFYRGSEPVPAADIDGTPRPQGAHPDAGAFEVKAP